MNQLKTQLLRCHIEAPDRYLPKARYALETLLRPLFVTPEWGREGAALYYGPDPASSASPVRLLLNADTIEHFKLRTKYDPGRAFSSRGTPHLFGTPEAPDLIASAFFFLSGWEEYVNEERDEHARFCHRHSILSDLGAVSIPLVDQYREDLARMLRAAGVAVRRRTWGERDWAFLPTFDIDYLREWRPGTILREAPKRPWSVLRGLLTGEDAFREGFHNILAILAAREIAGTFFFKAGDRSAYDPSYRRSARTVSRILGMVHEQGSEIGLHPGYFASTHPGYLREEHDRLEALSGRAVTAVRQHYLRYEIPRTPRLQQAEGLRIDSSLAFPDHEGFRRGTCLPFQVFDPDRNASLDLWEMPLCFMDSTMLAYRGVGAEESGEILSLLMRQCQDAGGACVVLWHNTLWEYRRAGWPEHLARTLERASAEGAWIGGISRALADWVKHPGRK